MKEKYLYMAIVILTIILVYQCSCNKKSKEGFYDGKWDNTGLDSHMTQRITFNSNLDPKNPNQRFDSNVYGGYIRGSSPPVDMMASTNQSRFDNEPINPFESRRENFGDVLKGEYPGVADSASFINKDFSRMASTEETNPVVSTDSKKPNTLDYTSPKDLLPTPDMRQPLMRDPSDPSNFMYDRTLFAPLKKRNLNEADRFRGDLDIPVIKTGWFDISTIPHVDLVKGYFGYYNDIEQYQDLQDISNEYRRDSEEGKLKANKFMSNITNEVGTAPLIPNKIWASQPDLKMPVSPFGQNMGVLNPL